MNLLQRDDALRQAVSSMSQSTLAHLTTYHKACLSDTMTALITAPLELVPGLQAAAQVHSGILKALTAGA